MTADLEHRLHATAYLRKAEEYLESAEDNFDLERFTPAAGDAIHAGICAKDAMVTMLTGATGKHKDHALAAAELRRALGERASAARAEQCLRQLLGAKPEVEYGTALMTSPKSEPLVRRARTLVEMAVDVVRAGG